jgi:hypothetical protein
MVKGRVDGSGDEGDPGPGSASMRDGRTEEAGMTVPLSGRCCVVRYIVFEKVN